MRAKTIYLIVVGVILLFFSLSIGLYLVINKNTSNKEFTSVSGQKEITLAELQKHNLETNCWIYLGGQVFDATRVIEQNQALKTKLITVCGKDGSSLYTVQKYTSQELDESTITKLRDALGKYQIGFLSPSN